MSLRSDEYLCASSSGCKYRCGAADLTMQQFLSYRSRYSEEAPLILFDKRFCDNAPALAGDFTVPPFFSQDLFSVLGPSRPDYRWLIIAAARSGSFFHKVCPFHPGSRNPKPVTIRNESFPRIPTPPARGTVRVFMFQRFRMVRSVTFLQRACVGARSG